MIEKADRDQNHSFVTDQGDWTTQLTYAALACSLNLALELESLIQTEAALKVCRHVPPTSGSHSLEKPEACPSCKGCPSGGRERGGTKLIMWFFSETLRKSIRGRDRLGVFTEGLCLSSYGCCDNLSQIYWLQPTNTVVLNFWRSENRGRVWLSWASPRNHTSVAISCGRHFPNY